MTEKKTQKMLDAQKAVIDALQETISAQERTILAKTRTVHALQDLMVLKHREPLVWFTSQMEQKLRANDHKDGWHDCEIDWLFDRLSEEAGELRLALQHRKGLAIIDECTDVANFAMMLADRVRE
jgi:hypothetical protein